MELNFLIRYPSNIQNYFRSGIKSGKRHILLLILTLFLHSTSFTQSSSYQKTYSVTNPISMENLTLELSIENNIVVAKRSTGRVNEKNPHICVFVECQLDVDTTGLVSVDPELHQHAVWYIPFGAGETPVNLSANRCLLFQCVNRNEMSGSTVKWNYDHPTISCEKSLSIVGQYANIPFIPIKDCETSNIYDYSNGGVIMEADSVKIIEPDWYDPKVHGRVIFQIGN